MAEVRLGKFEMDAERLPTICIRCGEPASVMREKRFQWAPTSVLLLSPIVRYFLGIAQFKAMKIRVPFCFEHRNHWFGRDLAIYLSLIAIVSVWLALMFWGALTAEKRGGDDSWVTRCSADSPWRFWRRPSWRLWFKGGRFTSKRLPTTVLP